MGSIVSKFWESFSTAIAAVIVGLALAIFGLGCTVTTKNNGQWRLTFGTQFGVETTSAQTAPEPSTVGVDFPSLEEWIKRPPPPEPAPPPSDGQ